MDISTAMLYVMLTFYTSMILLCVPLITQYAVLTRDGANHHRGVVRVVTSLPYRASCRFGQILGKFMRRTLLRTCTRALILTTYVTVYMTYVETSTRINGRIEGATDLVALLSTCSAIHSGQ